MRQKYFALYSGGRLSCAGRCNDVDDFPQVLSLSCQSENESTLVVDWARTAEQWEMWTAHNQLNNEKRVTASDHKKSGKENRVIFFL